MKKLGLILLAVLIVLDTILIIKIMDIIQGILLELINNRVNIINEFM